MLLLSIFGTAVSGGDFVLASSVDSVLSVTVSAFVFELVASAATCRKELFLVEEKILCNTFVILQVCGAGNVIFSLISQRPHISFPSIMRAAYTKPRHTTAPLNILEIGTENPIEAKKSGLSIRVVAC